MARMTVAPSVAVLASANFDLVGTAATLPRPGETVLGERFSTNPGGKGLNQAIAVARLGGACTAIAAVGDDSFGDELLAGLRADGRSEEHTSELQSRRDLVCRLLLEKKKKT